MKRILTLIAFLLPLAAGAQNTYVSAPLVKAMEGGKFYMKLSGMQVVDDAQWANKNLSISMELASREGVSMSRTHTTMMEGVVLTTDKGSYVLDEAAKTWRAQPGAGSFTGGKLTFVRQGSCRVNGSDGWYFDEYRAVDGTTFTFYYNSNQVSVLEIASGGESLGAMNLQSFSTFIPSNMYFCVGNDWKEDSASGGMDNALSMAGMDRASLEKQIREEMKGEELPPGMTIDDMVNMALGSMNGAAGAGSQPKESLFPAPPKCSKPWTDTGTPEELACGLNLASVLVTDKKNVSAPVYASAMKPAVKKITGPRFDREITEEGLRLAVAQLLEQSEGKTDRQIQEDILDFNGDANRFLFDHAVTGELVEMAIVRANVYPHPALLNTTGNLLMELNDTQRAEKFFEAAVEVEPGDIEPHYGLVECYLDKKDMAKAEREVNKIIEITPAGAVDGHALLLRAMFQAQKGNSVDAADLLFKSLAAGYFDSNSVSMIVSLLYQMEVSGIVAADKGPGTLDFKLLLDIVFCDENLNNIRKGITYSKEQEMHPRTSPIKFGSASAGNLESNAEYNRWMSDKLHARAESYDDVAKKDYNTPTKDLCWGMGADPFIQKVPGLAEAGYAISDVKEEAARNAKVQNAIDKGRKTFASLGRISGSYQKLTRFYGQKYGVDYFYIPDARTFWCLYLLNRYHELLATWARGGLGGVDENDNFKGCLPEAYKSMVIQDRVTLNRYKEVGDAMNKRHEKAALAKAKEVDKQIKAWDKAHPNAEPDVVDRAHRRIARPFNILVAVTQPTESLNDVETPCATELTMHYIDYYNSAVRPVMEDWWNDIDRYSQYFLDPSLATYFRFTTAFEGTIEQSGTYHKAAQEGESLAFTRELIEKARCQIMDEEYQDRKAAKQSWDEELEREMQEDAALPDKLLFGMLSTLSATLDTQYGTLNIGFQDGKWGVSLDPTTGFSHGELMYSAFRRFYGMIPEVNDLMDRLGFPPVNVMNEYNALDRIKKLAQSQLESFVTDALGAGGIPGAMVIAAAKAKAGTLVKTDSKTLRDEVVRDAAGNILTKKSHQTSVTLDGYGTYTRRDIQCGRARLREDTFTIPTPFADINLSQYNKRRRNSK